MENNSEPASCGLSLPRPDAESSLLRSNHIDCFGDWWDCHLPHNNEVKSLNEKDCSRAPFNNGHSISNKSDKSNLGNGELSQEVLNHSSQQPPTYFIELREESEMSQFDLATSEMIKVHEKFIEKYCKRRTTNIMDLLDRWFTRGLTLLTVLGIIFLFWVQNSQYHLSVKSQPKLHA